jgi:kynureninase
MLKETYGVIADARGSHIIRLAPVPLYSSYHDCWRAVSALAEVLS